MAARSFSVALALAVAIAPTAQLAAQGPRASTAVAKRPPTCQAGQANRRACVLPIGPQAAAPVPPPAPGAAAYAPAAVGIGGSSFNLLAFGLFAAWLGGLGLFLATNDGLEDSRSPR